MFFDLEELEIRKKKFLKKLQMKIVGEPIGWNNNQNKMRILVQVIPWKKPPLLGNFYIFPKMICYTCIFIKSTQTFMLL